MFLSRETESQLICRKGHEMRSQMRTRTERVREAVRTALQSSKGSVRAAPARPRVARVAEVSSTEHSPPNNNRCRCLLWVSAWLLPLLSSSDRFLVQLRLTPTPLLHRPTPAPETPRLRVKTPRNMLTSRSIYSILSTFPCKLNGFCQSAPLVCHPHITRCEPVCNHSLLFHFLVGAILIFEGSPFVAAGESFGSA